MFTLPLFIHKYLKHFAFGKAITSKGDYEMTNSSSKIPCPKHDAQEITKKPIVLEITTSSYRNTGIPTRTSKRWWTTGYAWIDLLYLPYTLMFVGFFLIGCMLAPAQNWLIISITTVLMFIAVGISAHCFDELMGRPLGTNITNKHLWMVGITSLAFIGIIMTILGFTYDLFIIGIFMIGAFLLVAYNLELFGGHFHGDVPFIFDYGLVPQLMGFYLACFQIPSLAIFCIMCGITGAAGVETVVNHYIKSESDYRSEYSPKFAYLQRAVYASLWLVYLVAIGLICYRLGW